MDSYSDGLEDAPAVIPASPLKVNINNINNGSRAAFKGRSGRNRFEATQIKMVIKSIKDSIYQQDHAKV